MADELSRWNVPALRILQAILGAAAPFEVELQGTPVSVSIENREVDAWYDNLRRYSVRPENVIVTTMDTTGRWAVVPGDIPTAITTKHLATITLDGKEAEPEFVSHALFRHPAVLHQIG